MRLLITLAKTKSSTRKKALTMTTKANGTPTEKNFQPKTLRMLKIMGRIKKVNGLKTGQEKPRKNGLKKKVSESDPMAKRPISGTRNGTGK